MSVPYHYPRPQDGSALAAPWRGDPSLLALIEAAFPGRQFRVRCNGTGATALTVTFDVALSEAEQAVLSDQVAVWDPFPPAPDGE